MFSGTSMTIPNFKPVRADLNFLNVNSSILYFSFKQIKLFIVYLEVLK